MRLADWISRLIFSDILSLSLGIIFKSANISLMILLYDAVFANSIEGKFQG